MKIRKENMQRKQWGFAQLIIITAIVLQTTAVMAAEKLTVLNCATNDFPPFGYMEIDKLKGIEVETMLELGRRLGVKIDIQLLPWKRMLESMKRGTKDCMFAAFKTAEREAYMDYLRVPLHVTSHAVFVNKDKVFPFESLDSLNGKTIGLVRGFKTSAEFDKRVKRGLIKVKEANDFEICFKMLGRGRIDAVLVNPAVGAFELKKHGIKNVVKIGNPLTDMLASAYITFSKKKKLAHLINVFDAALFDILTDGTYQRIYESYVSLD